MKVSYSYVPIFYFQEGAPYLFADIDVLLTLEQFKQAVPDTLASLILYFMVHESYYMKQSHSHSQFMFKTTVFTEMEFC